MSSSDNPQKGGGLWARLFGVSAKEAPPKERTDKPAEESPLGAVPVEALPLATPAGAALAEATVPLAEPVAAPPALEPESPTEELPRDAEAPVEAAPEVCPTCQAPRKGAQAFCDDCGWMFPAAGAAAAKPARRPRVTQVASNPDDIMAAPSAVPVLRLKDRYELHEL